MPEEALKQEIEDENEELEVEVDEEESEQPEEEAAAKPANDELEQYSEGVQKRISKLTAKMREAERREKAAIEYAQAVQTQLQQSNARTQSLDSSFVQEFENRVTLQDQLLRQQLREAIDRGDIDKQVEVQKQLAQVASHAERLQYVKQQQESNAARAQQPISQPVPQQQVAQQQQPRPDPKAEDWASRNEWFGTDEPMTITAFSIHKQLIENEGYDSQSDDYYQEIDRRMRAEFPHKFNEQSRARSGPAVGAANRGVRSGGKKSIKLSSSQVAIAKKLGITKEQYAKQLMRMNQS